MTTVALTMLAPQVGCVQRRMTIRSNPPGAMVYVDNYEIGTTPVSKDFTYYGTREIRLVKGGRETKTVQESIRTPWYQWPIIDFFSENLYPGEIRDHRSFSYDLVPQVDVPANELVQRGEILRAQSGAAGALPAPPLGATTAPMLSPSGATGSTTLPPGGNMLPPRRLPGPAANVPNQVPLGQPCPELIPSTSPYHSLPPGGRAF